MPRKKLKRFAEIETFPNVIRVFGDVAPGWYHNYFGNDNPITLEIACGKGEYTVGLARRYPDRNFIGIDKKGERIWRGAKIALEEGLKNSLFVRADAGLLAELFTERTISEIWIPFPDPFPQNSKADKRLTSPGFLAIYGRVLKPGGVIHLKTDDTDLFGFTINALRAAQGIIYRITFDLYDDSIADDVLMLKTTYERRHLAAGKTIKYIRFGLNELRSIS